MMNKNVFGRRYLMPIPPSIFFLEKLEGAHKECKTAYRALLFSACRYLFQNACQCDVLIQCVPLATEPGWLADRCSVSQQLGALQTHSSSFLTQRTYPSSNFAAISSLVLELLKKCRFRQRVGHAVNFFISSSQFDMLPSEFSFSVFIHSAVCLTLGPQHFPKRVLHILQSSGFSTNLSFMSFP
jgi:hypothetical protein